VTGEATGVATGRQGWPGKVGQNKQKSSTNRCRNNVPNAIYNAHGD